MIVKFDTTRAESEKIRAIARRFLSITKEVQGKPPTLLHVEMDITACHCNGNKLHLDELAVASDFDLVHDVAGIMRHLDRDTGKLTNCFSPRYSR